MKLRLHPSIENLVPYKPGKPIGETQREFSLSKVIKLASNENPLGLSAKVKEALTEALTDLHRYPDPTCYELLQDVAMAWKVPTDRISFSNGSDEFLDHLTNVLCESGEKVVTSESAFVAYEVAANSHRLNVLKTPVLSGYRFDLAAMESAAREDASIRIAFVANPNNPTGTYVNAQEMRRFLTATAKIPNFFVVVDEAYNEFVRAQDFASVLPWTQEFDHLIVLKTFSKVFALAGLRIGAMIAHPSVIEIYNRVRKPFNVNSFAQVAARVALKDSECIAKTQQVTWAGLDYFYDELGKLNLPFVRSEGNFVFFDSQRPAAEFNKALLKEGVILRPLLNYGFPTQFRMSVGLPEENAYAIEKIRKVLTAK